MNESNNLPNNELEPVFITWDEEDWNKMVGQFTMHVANLMQVFNCYGLGVYIQTVINQIKNAAIDLSMRARGDTNCPIGDKNVPLQHPFE